jgi:hypothetical protein
MNPITTATTTSIATQEQMEPKILAREGAGEFTALVQWYQKHYNLSPEEAAAKANEIAEEDAQRILRNPPQSARWYEIDHVTKLDAQKGAELWAAIKREALDDLRSGHRAARAMQAGANTPWDRAKFLAIRQELSEEWQPRNGIERQLIDAMTLAQCGYFHWVEQLTLRTSLECVQEKQLTERGEWKPPRIDDSKAIEQAALMMDRFNKIFLRSLRALRDLRRYASKVIVQNAAQVNVGGQQMNVSA